MKNRLATASAIALGRQLMLRANLAVFFALALYGKRKYDYTIKLPQWLNRKRAKDFERDQPAVNGQYVAVKLTNLAETEGVAPDAFVAGPINLSHPKTLCVHEGAIRRGRVGLAISKLMAAQDKMFTALLWVQAITNSLRISGVDVINAENLTAYQTKVNVNAIKDEGFAGTGVIWHLLSSDYVRAVELLREMLGESLAIFEDRCGCEITGEISFVGNYKMAFTLRAQPQEAVAS